MRGQPLFFNYYPPPLSLQPVHRHEKRAFYNWIIDHNLLWRRRGSGSLGSPNPRWII